MKKYTFSKNILILWVAGAILTSSCKKVLNIDPISQINVNQFWKTPADAKLGVAAIYDGMQEAYKTKYYLWGEMRGDNYIAANRVTNENLQLINNDLQPSNAPALQWDDFYVMINRANLAINNIPSIQGYDVSLLAEAYALRAYAYFDAIRVWGKVPLYLKSVDGLNDEAYKTQTEGDKIMAEVILPDVLKAEQLMAIPSSPYRFSKASVWALEADIYWYLKDYAKAKVALDKIIALKAYSLVNDRDAWLKLFLADAPGAGVFETGPEQILSLKYDLLEDKGQAGNSSIFFAGIPSFFVSPLLESKWTTRFPLDSAGWTAKYPLNPPLTKNPDGTKLYGDWRYYESVEQGRVPGDARVAKYQKSNQSPSIDETDIHIYRYAGILLQKAIIENQLNNKQAAIDLLNQIRVARQLPQVKITDFVTKDELENYLLDERQFELLAEGKRWWDLIATDKAVSVMGPINGQTAQKLLFPVFDRHLIDNTKLVQTTGY